MGRVKVYRKINGDQCRDLLVAHRVPERFAAQVGQTLDSRGPGAAMTQLHAGGWEIQVIWVKGEPKLYVGRCLGMKGDNGGEEES